MDKYSYIANAHADYIDELYKSYRQDPNSVDISWQQFFQGFDFSTTYNGNSSEIPLNGTAQTQHSEYSEKEIKVKNLIQGYRFRGHLEAKTNPIRPRKDRQARLSLADFGLSESDLNSKFLVGKEIGLPNATLQEILNQLDKVYKGAIGFEYEYVREPEILDWFKQKVEVEYPKFVPSVDQKLRILSKLNEAATFENFLQTKFIGQKRFSLEGGESTIPALDAIVNKSSELGVEEVVIGMAHRGRLNVLANTMGKTYEHIFNEFQGGGILEEEQGSGDVKYHMGFSSQITTPVGKTVNMKLAPNPSHLEAVNPVVAGYVRAKVDHIYNDFQKALPIIIHGDAAVAGQGIVYEMMQMSALKGYTTGGTIHFVINNQVGFTTDFEDGRSSIYCTDITEIVDSPVLHVNGDNPEAVVFACEIAAEYRQKFGRDIFIDMVCYRRHGHNESDEPKFTQPTLYNLIGKHPNPRDIYAKKLVDQGDISAEVGEKMDKEFRDMLQDRLNFVKQNNLPYKYQKFEKEWKVLRRAKADDFDQSPATNITQDSIDKIAKALTTLPENFEAIKQIQKLIEERKKGFFQDKVLTWAMAELLAYGSLLLEDKIVRLSGQDVERGTFSHRHAIVHHAVTSEPYSMLDNIAPEQEKLHIYNSLLS
ncbi:MAG: 2-oxoglutarate dehydrogenase E1 component, partial [Bacteroidetes bacterium]